MILVPQHSRREALVQLDERAAGEDLEQPELDALRHDRDRLEQIARVVAESGSACEHGVTNRRRDLPYAGRERLGHEERISARLPVQVVGIDPVRRRELRHGVERECR